ncbi:MAG: DEAD/DEAH box helicase [Planctomycetota bacterium]
MTETLAQRPRSHAHSNPHTHQAAPKKPESAPAFADLGLIAPILRALRDEKYAHPTPIQAQAIPPLLEGRDMLGCARTGTGKTAAFVLPIVQRLTAQGGRAGDRSMRCLILVPTRELASQVQQSILAYGRHLKVSSTVVFGGVGQGNQVRALSRGVDILVATPGRLLDLIGQGHARLDQVEILVLDEADRMLDLGFLPDVKKLLRTIPKRRQTLLFSATMPTAITSLAEGILDRPLRVFVTPEASTVEEIEQSVHFVDSSRKGELLAQLLRDPAVRRALVFTRTKRGADRVARGLVQNGIHAVAIHGNKSQNARERALEGFRKGKSPILVATDIAARGIDVDDVTHVVNYELPNIPESYVHRIGRTARAGASGIAISLCGGEERAFLRDIERLIKRTIRVAGGDPTSLRSRPPEPKGHGPRSSGSPRSGRPKHHGHAHKGGSGGGGRSHGPSLGKRTPRPPPRGRPSSSKASHHPQAAFGAGTGY